MTSPQVAMVTHGVIRQGTLATSAPLCYDVCLGGEIIKSDEVVQMTPQWLLVMTDCKAVYGCGLVISGWPKFLK